MAPNIKYIPPQMDPLARTSAEAAVEDPLRLLVQDTAVLMKLWRLLPYIVLPFRTKDQDSECYMDRYHVRDMALQSWLCIFEALLLILAPIAILVLPGAFLILATSLAYSIIYVSTLPMQGSRIVHSKKDEATALAAKEHGNERWLFINGCITSHGGLQENVDRLAKTFGRTVTGIHNQTYGLPGDLIECLIQRCLSYSTMDARVAYEYVKACLIDPTVTKIVIIAHSQGGIIISLALDHLFADLPAETFSKLEIYSFGCAASHFNNPRLSLSPCPCPSTTSLSPPLVKDYIPHIEHYVNELDLVPRWGVLHNTASLPSNRYAGSVFIRMGASGHMFNQHYLGLMFPFKAADGSEKGGFLDELVGVDEVVGGRRLRAAGGRGSQGGGVGDLEGESVGVGFEDGDGDEDGEGMSGTREMRGKRKRVRDLSRLWMYLGGGSPAGE